jgi:hypothetical protein
LLHHDAHRHMRTRQQRYRSMPQVVSAHWRRPHFSPASPPAPQHLNGKQRRGRRAEAVGTVRRRTRHRALRRTRAASGAGRAGSRCVARRRKATSASMTDPGANGVHARLAAASRSALVSVHGRRIRRRPRGPLVSAPKAVARARCSSYPRRQDVLRLAPRPRLRAARAVLESYDTRDDDRARSAVTHGIHR